MFSNKILYNTAAYVPNSNMATPDGVSVYCTDLHINKSAIYQCVSLSLLQILKQVFHLSMCIIIITPDIHLHVS